MGAALKHRIFPRDPEGRSLTEPLIVSIDLSEIAFTSDAKTLDHRPVAS